MLETNAKISSGNCKIGGKTASFLCGFTLIEVIVGTAVFLIITMGVYQAYSAIFNINGATRFGIDAVDLANEQIELVRNLPYASVGIKNSIPNGVMDHVKSFVRDNMTFYATTTIRNVDDSFDGTLGGTPNDTAPADYKTVEVEVGCPACKNFSPVMISTTASPKNLESTSVNGSLFIKVFDANGQPISGASVHVVNNQVIPAIVVDDVTNNSGMLGLVDVPPGVNAYEITVSKPGYTTDKTYTASVDNPNPAKPNATVAVQQVTQLSFAIDKVSTLNVSSVTDVCVPVPSVNFTLSGSKLLGTSPDVLKYPVTSFFTNGSGIKNISNLEWDNYDIAFTDANYYLAGANPPLSFNIAPDAIQNLQLVVVPQKPESLLVSVRDSGTSLPVSDATVTLTKDTISTVLITGRGYLTQTDWSGGRDQDSFGSADKYFSSVGVDVNNPAGDIVLQKFLDQYTSDGSLESSTFDTGGENNFHSLIWSPQDQPAETGSDSVRFQVATNNDGVTWNYLGPDGTANTYYTTSNANISSAHNGNRYFRYKVFLHSDSAISTPNISQVSFTYTSACMPPGQVIFSGLDSGTYDLKIQASGYQISQFSKNVSLPFEQINSVLTP